MNYYKIYGYRVISDIDFQQLLSDKQGKVDIIIKQGRAEKMLPDNAGNERCGFGQDFSWLENKTCYLAVSNGCEIVYQLKEGGNELYLRTYILGWGLAMLALQRGMAAIHCSAVADRNAAVLFCGESGSGKSTVTRAYLEQNWKLMADDMAFVEYREDNSVIARSAFPYQKLCRDAAEKTRLPLEELIYIDEEKDKFLVPCHDIFEENQRPLKAIIILTRAAAASVQTRPLQGIEAFYACVNNLFLRHLLGDRKYEPIIAQGCLKIASAVPVYLVERPYDTDTTRQVLEAVRAITDGIQ